jgi:hypothetical protein
MRTLALALVLLAACDPAPQDDVAEPDAGICYGDFRIVAPEPGLHYAPSLPIYVDEFEIVGDNTVTMVDSQGTSYAYASYTYVADPETGATRDDYFYDLAPNERYTFTITNCPNQTQSVTFFTSAR